MMNSAIFYIFATTCWLLMMNTQRLSASSALPKPILKIVTKDPTNNIMKGDNLTLKCTNAPVQVNLFYFVHEKPNGKNETLNGSSSSEFPFVNIQSENNGDYFCKYYQGTYSELSSPLNMFVQDKFPSPDINVSPRRVVQPGATITITCKTRYTNVEFCLLKNGVIIKNGLSGRNPFSHMISNASKENMGYYSCRFKSRSSGMQSGISNAMKISVLELPAPSMTWEENPSDSTMVRINCTVPENLKYNKFFFTLLDGSNVIEDDIMGAGKRVIFSITKPKYISRRYQCLYRVKYDYDYADSLHCILQIEGSYVLMSIRHILSAMILILIGVILLLHFKNFGNIHQKRPDLPPARVIYRKGSKISKRTNYEEKVKEAKDPI
ncbi:immunoglobulin superfamily member 1-like [Phyllobates terribilis]|uniref:immunoglobulin superfamily member 1-like n=1 Tax=Phyllobates terribilis TaxID=111132 RepID=UPI003CCB518F